MRHIETCNDRKTARAEKLAQDRRIREARDNDREYRGHAKANERLGRRRLADRDNANRAW